MIDKNEIKNLLKNCEITPDNSFLILQSICQLANQSQGESDVEVQALVLRALDRYDYFQPYQEILSGLIRRFGLYPYLQTESLTAKDAIARELHRPTLLNEDQAYSATNNDEELIFHRVQAALFRRLIAGESIVLSAPTSFGKSLLIDALIESRKFKNVVIVVPTIALIDETRRRLSRFKETHKVITHASQEQKNNNIFILTQERAIDFPNIPEIDLFVLDEFYKLDPRADAERAMTLNHAFYKLIKKSKQFYLLGPNIQNIPNGFSDKFNCHFIRTDFSTVVTELVKINSSNTTQYDQLINLCNEVEGPTLIFCASPQKARKITRMLADELKIKRKGMKDAAQWTANNYHPEWTLVKGLNNSIGMHHGHMPRALSQLCVDGFNEGNLQFLVCTSTLIEGVNTKAKNVIIFDNTIARKKYDFFTFNNIRGRSGRMFKHFIGNVYIFHDPPQQELPIVDVPVFSQNEENTHESLLLQLDEVDLRDNARKRLDPYIRQSFIDISTLKQNSGIDPNDQISFAKSLFENPIDIIELAWSGYPDWKQLLKLCDAIWNYFIKSKKRLHSVISGRQLAFKINQARSFSINSIINKEIEKENNPDDAVEETLDFIRYWLQYSFPRLAMGVCRIQRAVAEKLSPQHLAEYSFYAGQVENIFSDPAIVALDEYGLPFPIANKLQEILNPQGSLDKALRKLTIINVENIRFLTAFERELVENIKKSL